MRKFIFMAMLALSICMLASCEGNKKETRQEEQTKIETLIVENTISSDREYMFLNYGGDYRWYETCILMQDFMDEEPNNNITEVTSIFQVVSSKDETSYDVHVVKISHKLDGTSVEVIEGFWVEDYPLNDEEICVTYEEAWNLAMETNCPKPHSKHCVLRKEIGPKDANPQYIFGNSRCQIYVDVQTGEATPVDPVFIGSPLGEWP